MKYEVHGFVRYLISLTIQNVPISLLLFSLVSLLVKSTDLLYQYICIEITNFVFCYAILSLLPTPTDSKQVQNTFWKKKQRVI